MLLVALVGAAPVGSAWLFQDPGLPGLNIGLGGCPTNAPVRTYNVTALKIPVSYNHWGDFDPEGRVFVPTELVTDLLNQVVAALESATLVNATNASGPKLFPRLLQNVTAARSALAAQDLAGVVAASGRLDSSLFKDQNETNQTIKNIDATGINPFVPSQLLQPLILRARVGECVHITLLNLLPEMASIHVHGVVANPGQGTDLGANPNDLTLPGLTRVYKVYIPTAAGMEGAHFLHSHADSRFQTKHGLFGALVAEPAGSNWTAPDGSAKNWGQDAIIVPPTGSSFREFVLMYHDEVELWNVAHVDPNQTNPIFAPMPVVSPYGEYGPGSKALNLRSEPFFDRFQFHDRQNLLYQQTNGTLGLPRGHDKSQAYGSYTYGDPPTFFAKSYVGDPTKWRLVNAGPGQGHVHHLHGGGDRWRVSPVADDTQFDIGLTKSNPTSISKSERVDVQNIGPGESFNAEIEGGAGGVQQSVGDFLYHCHIVEHYLAGMWGFWRVYDTLQLGLSELPGRTGQMLQALNSTGLLGKALPNGTVLNSTNIAGWVESQLPPRGVPVDNDASVWDWTVEGNATHPLYKGEPDDGNAWPNYASPLTAGVRPEIKFNPANGRLAYPLLRPHLGKRPPFAPDHGPSPYLGARADANHPDGLCPTNAPDLNYTVVALNTTVWYNRFDADKDGSIFVHAKDKAAVLAGTKNATSFVIRANQGDCVNLLFSSQMSSAKSKVNMHIHLVQFDIQASDGVITGFNFEQSVRPANVSGTTFQSASGTVMTVANGTRLRVNTTVGIGLTNDTLEARKILAIDGNQVTLDRALSNAHAAGELVGPEFVQYQWFPDVQLGMVYWHDHVDGLHSWLHGLFGGIVVEPPGSQWCNPKNLSGCENVTEGHVVDIVNADQPANRSRTYREIVLQVQDRGCIRACTAGTEDPRFPDMEDEPATIGLKSEPLHRRNRTYPLANWANYGADEPGTPEDERQIAQGNPATDMLKAYPGDPVVVRLLYAGQSTTTGVATFGVTGHRFAFEPNLTGSRTVDALSFGISSMHNLHIEDGAGGRFGIPGDYLYYLTNPDLLDRGAWGVFRVLNTTNTTETGIRVLESNTNISVTGDLPTDGPVRQYNVTAFRARVLYNAVNNEKPLIKLFALSEDVEAIKAGNKRPHPLVLRALAGELVKVNLTVDWDGIDDRASLHASLLSASPAGGQGIVVGNTTNVTVVDGENRTYTFYADKELGVAHLTSFAHLIAQDGSRANDAVEGLYGAIVIEPANSTVGDWTGITSYVTPPGGGRFREHVLLYASNDRQFESSTMNYNIRLTGNALVDYRTEPLDERVCVSVPPPVNDCLGIGMGLHSCNIDPDFCGDELLGPLEPPLPPRIGGVRFEVRNPLNPLAFSIRPPETPRLDAVRGEPTVIRVGGGAGDQLNVHSLDGHWWAADPDMANCHTNLTACKSNLVSALSLGPGEVANAWLPEPGPASAGDYLWYSHRDPFLEAGAWGILTVCDTSLLPPTDNPSGPACATDNPKVDVANQVANATGPFVELVARALNDTGCLDDFPRCVNDVLADISCLTANATSSATVELPLLAASGVVSSPVFWGFQPRCVALNTTGTLTFRNMDPVAASHDPATFLDADASEGSRCFKAAWDRDGDNLQLTQPGPMPKLQPSLQPSVFDVKLKYDGTTLSVSVDGGLTWRNCSSLKDSAYSTSAAAVVRYRCDIHPNMQGDIVVRATSGGSNSSMYTYQEGSSPTDGNDQLVLAGLLGIVVIAFMIQRNRRKDI